MPARQLERRWILGEVKDCQIILRASIIWIQYDRFSKSLFCRGSQTFLTQREAEKILDLRVLRIRLRGAAQCVQSFVIFVLAEFQIAENRECVGIIGRDCE